MYMAMFSAVLEQYTTYTNETVHRYPGYNQQRPIYIYIGLLKLHSEMFYKNGYPTSLFKLEVCNSTMYASYTAVSTI